MSDGTVSSAADSDTSAGPETTSGSLVALWALSGVAILFGFAVFRLLGRGLETVASGLTTGQWFGLVGLSTLFLYGEGVVALQRKWVPRVLERTRDLRTEESRVLLLLAPLVGMGLVSRSGPTMARAWAGTAAIVVAVLVVRGFPSPWRGITSFAVSLALAWALGALLLGAPSALRTVRSSEAPRND